MNAIGRALPRLGYPLDAAELSRLEREDREERLRMVERELGRSEPGCIPASLMEVPLEELISEERVRPELLSQVGGWTPAYGNLLLLGDTGAGKTHLAAYLLRRVAAVLASRSVDSSANALRCRWYTARQLGDEKQELRNGRGTDMLERAKRAWLVVIDDVGQDGNRNDVFDVLDHRYIRGTPTIVTSGLTIDAIKKRYGDETRRRLMENRKIPSTIASWFEGEG